MNFPFDNQIVDELLFVFPETTSLSFFFGGLSLYVLFQSYLVFILLFLVWRRYFFKGHKVSIYWLSFSLSFPKPHLYLLIESFLVAAQLFCIHLQETPERKNVGKVTILLIRQLSAYQSCICFPFDHKDFGTPQIMY